eukprot:snap_masked-scaffold_64-processed-gene-0.34-mRNA-1 protein AED:0.31 eAED:0.31 QI:0/0/0/1/1/1/2/0/268
MQRYLEIWMFCAQLEDDEVSGLILGEEETRTLEKRVDFLATCDRYAVALQKGRFNLGVGKKAAANLLRDYEIHPSMLKCLEDDADNLVEFDELDQAEVEALSSLVKDPSEEEVKTPPGDSVLTEFAAQKRKSRKKSTFTDVSFIPATLCSVERLFSQYKLFLNDKINRMMPVALNRVGFLKMNQDGFMDLSVYFSVINEFRVLMMAKKTKKRKPRVKKRKEKKSHLKKFVPVTKRCIATLKLNVQGLLISFIFSSYKYLLQCKSLAQT